MKSIRQILFSLSLLLLLSIPAQAEHTGPYVGGFFGGNLLMDAKGSDSQGNTKFEFKPGLQGSAVVGWDLATGNQLGEGRVELEYNHRSNRLDKVSFAEGSFPGSGNLTADSLLLNCIGLLRDKMPWAPYVALGAGAARIEAANLKVSGQTLSKDSTVVFAYQLGAGIDYALTDYLNLDLGYRFFGSTRPKFTDITGEKLAIDYYSHNVVVGVRLGF